MATPTPPLDKLFPNRDGTLEDGIPLLCTILFGFSGVYFATIGAVKPGDLGRRSLEYIFFFGQLFGGYDVRQAVMILSAICCACFYISAVSAIYAKMLNTDSIVINLPSNRLPDQIKTDDIVVDWLGKRRRSAILFGVWFLNAGVLILPLSFLVFVTDALIGWSVIAYLAIVAVCVVFTSKRA